MTLPLVLYLELSLLLILLLAWALRPPKRRIMSPNEVFDALSETRHHERLPQILQALRDEDSDYIKGCGHGDLVQGIRAERKRIALRYLDCLEDDFGVLLEASRILAALSPEVIAFHEFERFKLALRFTFFCHYLRWRLRLGLQPWGAFGAISDIAGSMTLRLEAATGKLGERSAMASDYHLFLKDGRSDRE